MCLHYFNYRQFGQFDYGQGYSAQHQADAQYYPSAVGYSGSILTPDMSYTQQAGDTNFEDEPPLLEGELCRSVFFSFCPSDIE